jgi:hypothetical protein
VIPGPCHHCDRDSIVLVNGRWLCADHLDIGFREALEPLRTALEHTGGDGHA